MPSTTLSFPRSPVKRSESFAEHLPEEPKDTASIKRMDRSQSMSVVKPKKVNPIDEHKALVEKINTMEGILKRNNEKINENEIHKSIKSEEAERNKNRLGEYQRQLENQISVICQLKAENKKLENECEES